MAVTCSGKSLIPFNIAAFQGFIDSVVPVSKLPEFNIKLDARSKVKSVFAKLVGQELTIYTGAIISLGAIKFPEIADDLSLVMLFTIFGIKKAGMGVDFEIKTTDPVISSLKSDVDFKSLADRLDLFMQKFLPLNVSEMSVEPVVTEKKSSKNVSLYKDIPLGATPQIDVPPDLDLRNV